MGDSIIVDLFSPRAIAIIQQCSTDILNGLTSEYRTPDGTGQYTKCTDIFKSVVTQELCNANLLQYQEMPPSPQWLWFALCNRCGFFRTTNFAEPLNDLLAPKIKSLYMLFYSDSEHIRIDEVIHCLERLNIEEGDTRDCDDNMKDMITLFTMSIQSIVQERQSVLTNLQSYVSKDKLGLKYPTPRSEDDTPTTLSDAYVDETPLQILLFNTVLRLVRIFNIFLNIIVTSYIFAPGVLHYFFHFPNDIYAIIEITDRITFIHEESPEVISLFKSVGENRCIPNCSNQDWWDMSVQNLYYYSVYSSAIGGISTILAPIRHDLEDFTSVKLENIQHALERSRLRGELQLGFVDKNYNIISIKKTTVTQWEDLSLYFMVPFMKIPGYPAPHPTKFIDKWTQRHSLWMAMAATHTFIGDWTNIAQVLNVSMLTIMPIEIELFTGPIDKSNAKTYEILLPILIKNQEEHISGVYGDCMIISKNGHWGHLTKEVLCFLILCKKYHAVKTWLLNVNTHNNKEFVKSLHPLMSRSYNNPTEIILNILKKTVTEDDVIEHTAKLLRPIERNAWSMIKGSFNSNINPLFSERFSFHKIADD